MVEPGKHYGWGWGAIGGFKVKFVGGRVGVGTPYLPLPPLLHPGKPCRARSVHRRLGGEVGEGAGKIGAS